MHRYRDNLMGIKLFVPKGTMHEREQVILFIVLVNILGFLLNSIVMPTIVLYEKIW